MIYYVMARALYLGEYNLQGGGGGTTGKDPIFVNFRYRYGG